MPGTVYSFGPYALDSVSRRVTREGTVVHLPDRQVSILIDLLAHAGTVRSKDALVAAGWADVAVTDNSLEQAISSLRRALGPGPNGEPFIQTVARQGYRFTAPVVRSAARATDDVLDGLLAPHRAWIEGRAALETLERDAILRARGVFERVLGSAPDQASAHVGMANACVMQFEMTRADESPHLAALEMAARHAREACRLDPGWAEAWATLGFILDRTGDREDAAAASRRAVTIEPDNWRHQVRLAYVSWGEERLRAAHRALALLPGFPLAHWLAATVYVARQALDEAERELASGIAEIRGPAWQGRFSAVALHWLHGLVLLAGGRDIEALDAFERELASESGDHVYARECCANAWYAVGVVRMRQARLSDAREAFARALERVRAHPMARLARDAISRASGSASEIDRAASAGATVTRGPVGAVTIPVDAAMLHAAGLVLAGLHEAAATTVDAALAAAPAKSSAGWILPVEPLLETRSRPSIWAGPLARLRARAS